MNDKIRHIGTIWSFILCLLIGLVPSLHAEPIDTVTFRYRLCPEDTMHINGVAYHDPGTYYMEYSEDTTYRIVITQYPRREYTTTATFDGNVPYTWTYGEKGREKREVIYLSGTYERYMTNSKTGCQDIYRLVLRLADPDPNSNMHTESATTCFDEPYAWRGKEYSMTGQYRDSVYSSGGSEPDTIFILNLSVLPQTEEGIVHLYACGPQSIIQYKGVEYTRDTMLVTHEVSYLGCDSIVRAYLHFNTATFQSDTMYVTKADYPFTWHGQTITRSGTYTDKEPTTDGDCYNQFELVVIQKAIERDLNMEGCLPDGVRFQNTMYYNDTTFDYQLFNDTLYHVSIRVGMGEKIVLRDTICEEDLPYLLGETSPDTIWKEGYYSHREPIEYGCFKSWELYLRIRPSLTNEHDSVIVCDRDIKTHPVYIGTNGFPFTSDTVVTDCKGHTYHVIVRPAQVKDSVYYLCEGDSLRFDMTKSGLPRWIASDGIYYDTVPSESVCDSIIRLQLKVLHTYVETVHRTITAGDSIRWDGQWLRYTGVYDSISDMTDIATDSRGEYCHALHQLHLSVIKPIEATICDNEQYRFGENVDGSARWISRRGYYYDTIHNAQTDCDSIVALTLHVNPTFTTHQTVHVADTMSQYIWAHRWTVEDVEQLAYDTLRYAGEFRRVLQTRLGCDSIDSLSLVVHPTYLFKENYELTLPDSTYIWHGQEIVDAGVYYDSLKTYKYQFDSIYQLTVTTHYEYHLTQTICEGDNYVFLDDTLSYAGNYTKTVSGALDTIYYLQLLVNPISLTKQSAVITAEELPYIYNGHWLDTSGTYYFTLKNQYQCDSIIHFTLTVTEHISSWDRFALCPGQTLMIDGHEIDSPGEYTFPHRSQETGLQDSLYRVEVFAVPSYDFPTVSKTIMNGDTVEFGGVKLTKAGHYDISLQTIYGCDSLLHMDLSVQHELYDTICLGDTYTWRDKEYDVKGVYHDTVQPEGANYASYYTLYLEIRSKTLLYNTQAADLCADDSLFSITFNYEGSRPTRYSLLFDQMALRAGFVNVVNAAIEHPGVIEVPVPKFPEICYLTHTRYVRPDIYSMRIHIDNGACGIFDSDTIYLQVNYPNWIIEQNWNHIVAPLKEELNGGYEFEHIEWILNDSVYPTDSMGYLYNPKLHVGDEVYIRATRKGEDYAIPSCPLYILAAEQPKTEHPTVIIPSSTSQHMPSFIIEASQSGTYAIYSMSGALLTSGKMSEGETAVRTPGACGIYLVRTTQGNETQTHKLTVY